MGEVSSSREALAEALSVFGESLSLVLVESLLNTSERREVLRMADKGDETGDFGVGEVECWDSISWTTNAAPLHESLST